MNSLHKLQISKGLMLLFSGLLFLSCKKDNSTLKLPGESEVPINTLYSDTFTVKLSNVLVYSDYATYKPVRSNIAYTMVGGYSDANLGNMKVKSFLQMKLNKQFVDLSDITIDSVFVELDIDNYFGDTTQSQTLEVYQLDQEIQEDESYRANSPDLAYSNLLGTKTFTAYPKTGTNIRIPISNSAYYNAIVNGPKNNTDLFNQFYGIAIVPTNSNGAAVRVNLSSAASGFFIYYKQSGENKTYSLNFKNKRYFNLSNDLSGTPLNGLTNEYDEIPSENSSNLSFFQAGSGIRTKITFPYLKNLISETQKIYIHKAVLVIPYSGSAAPDSVYLTRITDDGEVAFISGFVSTIQFDDEKYLNSYIYTQYADYNESDMNYKFQLRNYLQHVVYGELNNNGLFLTPNKNNISFSGGYTFDQINSTKIQLKLYYTINN